VKNTSVQPSAVVSSPRDRALGKARDLVAERTGSLPVWVRAPIRGPERYSGLTRPHLYRLAAAGAIDSTAIRQPGKIRGIRLFHLESILRFIAAEAGKDVAS
jgi:hypothetical protein